MRRWSVALAACLVVAVGVPVGWWLTRPSASDGVPVTSVGAPTTTASPAAASATGDGPASPGARQVPSVPARPAAPRSATNGPTPVRIAIPAIDVRAAVDPVGVTPDGVMVVPREVDRVGWYRFGAAPGAPSGAAVVAGHVDSRAQGPGALFRLREVGVGDLVDVRLSNGASVTYRVVGKETIVKKRLPTERLFARDGSPRLVLITCGGPFIPGLSSYRDNVVVVAEPVDGAG